MTHSRGWKAPDHHVPPVYGQPVVAQPPGRSRRPWLVVGVTLAALAAAGGAAATALVLRGGAEPLVAQPRPVAQDDQSGSTARSGEGDSTAGFDGGPSNSGPPPGTSIPNEALSGSDDPEATMRAHWASIAAGDYQSAYDTFASAYNTSRSDWIAVQQDYGPRVADVQATTVSNDGDTAQVEVSVLTRDAGRGADTCNRFSGFVLMVREGGVWQYRPRPPEDDPSYFQRTETGISSSDAACAPTFG